jgi:hypothetical protein
MSKIHSFHIPVMGTAFSIDTPIKVAKFGIDSVMQIMDDYLCERMREYWAGQYGLEYKEISRDNPDCRAERIKAYLDLLDSIVKKQIADIKAMSFEPGNDLTKYFELLAEDSSLKQKYIEMLDGKTELQAWLKEQIKPGSIDVNIMVAVDRDNYDENGELIPAEFSDALSALRGFANSTGEGAVVLSAGFNRRLNSYIEKFPGFFPDENGHLKKRIILKVSDYRSSQIQGKLFAKKGLWVSEFRVESGINCGGHCFPGEGKLLGPVMEGFKNNWDDLSCMLFEMCNKALAKKNYKTFDKNPNMRLTVQGGIGTYDEAQFLQKHYKADGTGWASPFLLVPEVTNLDDDSLEKVKNAGPEDLYTSSLSPLGVPFNVVKNTMSHRKRAEAIANNRPGSPCLRKHLCFNNEYGKPLCTASREFQAKKIGQIAEGDQKEFDRITQKACLCEDLAATVFLKYGLNYKTALDPIACPGPNSAYFSRIFSLADMVGHIYGRVNLLNDLPRPNMFIKEISLYIDYLKTQIIDSLPQPTEKQLALFDKFKENLSTGIEYYKGLIPNMKDELLHLKNELDIAVSGVVGESGHCQR